MISVVGCATHSASSNRNPGIEADAVVHSRDMWYAFRFGGARYSRFPNFESWKEIASPGGAFRPVAALEGIQGHFYLLDAAQGRLCLYDTGAQLISTFPLPSILLPWAPGRMVAFRGADGAFTFLDYASGEAWQFADRQGSEGTADWILRNRIRLPMGIRDCIQEPDSGSIACVLPDGPARFDASLNKSSDHNNNHSGGRTVWDESAREWTLEVADKDGFGFRFLSVQRRLQPIRFQ